MMIMMFAYLALLPKTILQVPAGCGLLPPSVASLITTNEPWYCPINQQMYNVWSQYLPLMILATLIAFIVAGILYMGGTMLNSSRIRNYGVAELYEAIATTIIVLAFLYICAVLFGVLPGLFIGNINPYAVSFDLITNTINQAQSLYTNLYYIYFTLSIYSSVTPTISGTASGLVQAGIEGLLGTAVETFVNPFNLATQVLFLAPARALATFLSDGITVLYAEYYLMEFFAVASIPVFIVPGVLFRAFMPTRALGGILISMGIGFYLIMPTLLASAYYFTAPGILTSMSIANAQFNSVRGIGITEQGAASPSSPIAVDLQTTKTALSQFWLLILFYPAFVIAITYSFIAQFASFIGGSAGRVGSLRRFI